MALNSLSSNANFVVEHLNGFAGDPPIFVKTVIQGKIKETT